MRLRPILTGIVLAFILANACLAYECDAACDALALAQTAATPMPDHSASTAMPGMAHCPMCSHRGEAPSFTSTPCAHDSSASLALAPAGIERYCAARIVDTTDRHTVLASFALPERTARRTVSETPPIRAASGLTLLTILRV